MHRGWVFGLVFVWMSKALRILFGPLLQENALPEVGECGIIRFVSIQE
jgi:hypothetical protein